jgi:hypothetical protein
MTRLRSHHVGKAESLFVANLKPFSTASVKMRRTQAEQISSVVHARDTSAFTAVFAGYART